MAFDSATASTKSGADTLLQSLVRGQRGEALRAQLALRYSEASSDAIEEAIQYACKSFLEEAEGITAPGQIYAWVRTAAFRSLGREADRHHREIAVDPVENGLDRISADEANPAEELIELEDDADLELLVREVWSSLSERRRDVLALYGAGYKRPQIADRLGLPRRIVKRDHLSHCGRCELFSERLCDEVRVGVEAPECDRASGEHSVESKGELMGSSGDHRQADRCR